MSDIEIKDSAESKLNELADKGVDSIGNSFPCFAMIVCIDQTQTVMPDIWHILLVS